MIFKRKSTGETLPANYFTTKPRFRAGYWPYSDEKLELCDDDGKVNPKAVLTPDGGIFVPDA